MIAPREIGNLARKMIEQAVPQAKVLRAKLIIRADNGSPMTSKLVALKMADLGVIKSHCRPQVSNGNPYSESHFKILKYRPEFSGRFSCVEDARPFCQTFCEWDHKEHQQSGIAWLTPRQVHYGQAAGIIEVSQQTLDAAFAKFPERFVRKAPRPQPLPNAVWINPSQEICHSFMGKFATCCFDAIGELILDFHSCRKQFFHRRAMREQNQKVTQFITEK